ncbi:MAG: glycosyltransferase family 4 protein [Nitrososphaerota archaeon]
MSDSIDVAGAEKVLLSLLQRINREKYQIYAVTPEAGLLSQEFNKLNIPCYHVKMNFKIHSLRYFRHFKVFIELIKITKQHDIDLVYCNRAIVGKYGSLLKIFFGVACIWHLHDFFEHFPGDRLGRFASVMIAVSHAVRNSYPILYRPLIQVVYNGTDFETLQDSTTILTDIRTELKINSSVQIVTLIARLTAWKGQRLFVEAAAKILRKINNVKFLIVGDVIRSQQQTKDKNFKLEMLELQKKLGLHEDVYFLGWRKDIFSIIAKSDIIVNSSIEPEPLGTTILEGMALGKPIVCTPSGGNSEMVLDGINGIVIKEFNAEQLAGAIETLLNNPELALKMGNAGKKRLKNHFSMESFVKQIETIIDNTLHKV